MGRTVTIGVDAIGLTLGGKHVPFAEIDRFRVKLEVDEALLRRAASARMTVHLTLHDGSTAKVAARNAASARRADAIARTLAYLWELLGETVDGPSPCGDIVDRIGRGTEVQLGGVRLTTIGIAWKRIGIVAWSDVGQPEMRDLHVVIPTEAATIEVPLSAEDAFMLPTLIPILRQGQA